jgi:tripartite-type tricarboxylate transporter receptor subunit TctC
MSELLGQQIIVDNRPGAGSSLASEMAAKSTPDGYTLVSIGSTHAVNAALNPKLPYAPAAGFHAIALVSTAPVAITANLSLPVKSLKDLIALAKTRPGQLNYGPGGVNGINHLAAELLKRMGGFDITLIPYKGVAQALPALIAGEVQLMFASLPGSIDQIRAGRIRAIAVTSAKRSNAAPDIPTVAESGVPGYDAPSWWGFLAPAGTPKAIITRLNADTLKVLRMRDVHELLIRQGMDPAGSTPVEFDAYLRADIAKWTRVVQEAGIKAN